MKKYSFIYKSKEYNLDNNELKAFLEQVEKEIISSCDNGKYMTTLGQSGEGEYNIFYSPEKVHEFIVDFEEKLKNNIFNEPIKGLVIKKDVIYDGKNVQTPIPQEEVVELVKKIYPRFNLDDLEKIHKKFNLSKYEFSKALDLIYNECRQQEKSIKKAKQNEDTAQKRWEKKAGYVSKTYKLPKNVTERFALACAKKEIPQNKVLETYMSYFCDSVENENTLPINADVTEAMVNMCDIIVNTSARYDIQQKMQIKDFMEKFLLTMKENQEENC